MRYRLSRHAREEMERRNIPLHLLQQVLDNPQQIVEEQNGRNAYQSRVKFGDKLFLLRVIVMDNIEPAVIVTVYRTSRISKYWRTS